MQPPKQQVFIRPTLRQLLAMIAGFIAMNAALPLLEKKSSLLESVLFGVGAGVLMTAICAGLGLQRVRISGGQIAVSTVETGFRWRRFNVNEVIEVRLRCPAGDSGQYRLVFKLRPSPGRKWNVVTVKKTETLRANAALRAPVFLALIDAVRSGWPAMTVQGWPDTLE